MNRCSAWWFQLSVALSLSLLASCSTPPSATSTPVKARNAELPNPLIEQRADAQVFRHIDGWYYFTASVPEYDRIVLRRSRTVAGLATAPEKVIWLQHAQGAMAAHIWAPELHFIDGKWYVYFTAGRSDDVWAIRLYVLENASADPYTGEWVEKGQLKTNWESFTLDATAFEHRGQRYLAFTQRPQQEGGGTNIYLARMKNPWTIEGAQVELSAPTYEWETRRYKVNEAPAFIAHGDKVFISYSASATDANYCIGLLSAPANADLMNPKSWAKSSQPVFTTSRENSQFGPGHNSFTTSEDGQQTLLVYHARSYEKIEGDSLYNPDRHTRVKALGWKADGTPDFGTPPPDTAPDTAPVATPSPAQVFIYPYFIGNGETGLYLAYSEDGRRFAKLNGGKPVFVPPKWDQQNLTRDASILWHNGLFRMVWTSGWTGRSFGYATSPDLVHWSEPRQLTPFPAKATDEDQPKNVWAPELSYDPIKQRYVIAFTSTLPRELNNKNGSEDEHGYDHRIYSISTADFRKFSAPTFYLDAPYSAIDAQATFDDRGTADKADDRWLMVYKSEMPEAKGGKNLRLTQKSAASDTPFPASEKPIVGPGSPLRPNEQAEGPTLLRHGDEWLLYWDAFRNKHYALASSKDLVNWTDETSTLSLPVESPRHGTITQAPRSVIAWPEVSAQAKP